MDDFGDNFVQPEVDPAAEFLAREQNQLAGLEDELETSAPPPVLSSNNSNGFDDFVGTFHYNILPYLSYNRHTILEISKIGISQNIFDIM